MYRKFVITSERQGTFLEESEPKLVDGQIMCRPLSVGLCGTDKKIFAGEMPAVKYPRVPCHEVAAEVISDGSHLGLKPGTAVCIDPYTNCGNCHACKAGRYNCCKFNQTLGVQRDGILRDRFVIDSNRVHVLPNGVDPRIFCLAEPLALALHIVHRAGDVHDKWCLVAGVGNIGKLVIRVLRLQGAKIIGLSRSSENLRQAELLGADVTVGALEPTAEEQVLDATGGEGVSVAFETAGKSSTVEVCIRLAAFAGRVVLVGHSKEVSDVYGSEIVFKELDIFGSRNSLGKFPKAIEMLAENFDYWWDMISHRYPMSEALHLFKLAQREDGLHSKIVIDFTE